MRQTESRAPAVWTALLAGGLGILSPVLTISGRAVWVAPVICIPFALGVGRLWSDLGSLQEETKRAGRWLSGLYYLWALVLLVESARGYASRLLVTVPGESPWLFLIVAAALCLWLARGEGFVTLRSGQLFFGVVAAVLGVAVVLSLPGLRWENLWPVEREAVTGLPKAICLCLSLTGYGIYGLCLPGGGFQTEKKKTWPWAVSVCALLAGLILALIGSFGPVLANQRPEPVLLLLEGVQVPGVFRHGEAALEGGLALADLTLMAVLTYGSKALWRKIFPTAPEWMGVAPALGAVLAAGVIPGEWQGTLSARVAPAGNLIFGAVLPAIVLLIKKSWKGNRR